MYGKTIKEIRKSKNMTLKEAAGEALSDSQLSRFENEKSMITIDLFYEILENLNSTTEEFNYIKNQEKYKDIRRLFARVEQYINNERLDELKGLRIEVQNTYPSKYSWEQFLIYFIDSILATYEEKEQSAKNFVLEYLMQVENWGEMELRLYAMFGFALDVETTYILMNTALKRSQQYQSIPGSSKLLHVILTNNFSTFLAHNRIDYAEEVIQLFENKYSENTDTLVPHIDFIFNKGLLAFKKNMPEKAKEYCERAIEICQLFRQKEDEKAYIERYKYWKKNYRENKNDREITIKFGFYEI